MKQRRRALRRCGDYGGRNNNGKPCHRTAGWGVKGTKEGQCKHHTAEADGRIAKQKETILADVAAGSKPLLRIAADIDVDPATIWRWRQSDADFDVLYLEALVTCKRTRVTTVADVLYRKCVSGDIAASGYKFYLETQAPEDWHRPTQIEHTGADGEPLIGAGSLAAIRQMIDDAEEKGEKI